MGLRGSVHAIQWRYICSRVYISALNCMESHPRSVVYTTCCELAGHMDGSLVLNLMFGICTAQGDNCERQAVRRQLSRFLQGQVNQRLGKRGAFTLEPSAQAWYSPLCTFWSIQSYDPNDITHDPLTWRHDASWCHLDGSCVISFIHSRVCQQVRTVENKPLSWY